jgi:uncharacterized protein YjbJ (UPF0337 family)
MEVLTEDVINATGLESSVAKAAVGHVLLFFRDEAPQGHIAEFIDKNPLAREAVQAAAATGDGGVTAAIEGLTSFMGHGRADVNSLAGKLENLGLSEEQIGRLVDQIMSRAGTLIGPEGAARIREILPALAERSGHASMSSEKAAPRAQTVGEGRNWEWLQGNWKQASGKIKEHWGKLTDDDIARIAGNREEMEGKLQQRYGWGKDQAKREVDSWITRE